MGLVETNLLLAFGIGLGGAFLIFLSVDDPHRDDVNFDKPE